MLKTVDTRAPWLVLGVGNQLFTDEGLGIVAALKVATMSFPDVDVVDGGTLGLAMTPAIEGRKGVLVFDAVVKDGNIPGDVLVLQGEEVPTTRQMLMSVHQIGVIDALNAAKLAGTLPEYVAACGIVPVSLEDGWGLTEETEGKIDLLVHEGLKVLASWGAIDPSQVTPKP